MTPLLDPSLDPLFWQNLRLEQPSAWHGHVPFAHWLVSQARPGLIVELGSHAGVSYAAFCQAVAKSGLQTRCVAVDTWQGDSQAGSYDETVYADLHAFNEANFNSFSTLRRATFDEAASDFADGSIDLLHIDGFHTYEAVRHDFETWLPKLSPRAVVLFHDIAVRERDFGVWRFWAEVTQNRPHFAFDHAFGLGILVTGPQPPAAVAELCAASPETAAGIRARFAALGAREEHGHATSVAIAVPEETKAVAPPPLADATLDIGQIFVAERFIGPALMGSLTLPRDALTRGPAGCAVWILTMDGADWRQATLAVQPTGQPIELVFRPFDTIGARHFHIVITGPCTAGTGIPTAIVSLLGNHRRPIALGSPDREVAIPNKPRRGIFLLHDGAIAPGNRESSLLPVTGDYANHWRDQYGAYLSGWTHCDADPVRAVSLVIGPQETELALEPRPDVLAHYPHAAMPVGWRGYVEGPAGLPLQLRVRTDTDERLFTPELPDRLTRMPTPDPLVSELQLRFVALVNTEQLRVLEIGGRVVGPEAIDWRARMPGAAAYLGLDIHPSPSVDIVGDAHHLTRFVPPGSQDAIWSADVIEHLRMPWLAAAEINRALRMGGYAFVIAPHSWPIHEAPADYWRFSDEGLKILFGPAFGFEIIESSLVEPLAIHPRRRNFPASEMPLHPGYGHAVILARKIAELPPDAGLEAHWRAQLGDSTNYPDTDRATREASGL